MDLYEIAKQEVIEQLEQAYLSGEITANTLLDTIEQLDLIDEIEFYETVYTPEVLNKKVN